jgi:alcohol dehydrogenase class IV
VTKLGPH